VAVKYVWTHILFFLPKVYGSDAIILTFILFATVNMIMCSAKAVNMPAKRRKITKLSILIGSIVIIAIFTLGMDEL
jgi:hypothetical protein